MSALTTKMPIHCSARRNLGDQIVDLSGYLVLNLGAMYRAAGQPYGKDPWTWAELAAPVLAALVQYERARTRLPIGSEVPAVYRLEVRGDEDLGPYDFVGDAVTPLAEVALVYSYFLDRRLPEESPGCNADLDESDE